MNIDEVVAASRASQNKTELKMLLRFVTDIHPQVVVEIGLHKGYSLLDWCRAFHPKVAIGVQLGLEEIDKEAMDEIIGMGIELHLVDGDSTKDETKLKVKELLNERKIDFLYIDGDHHYRAVKSDFEFYSIFVRAGGIVGFDDIMLTDYKYIEAGVEVNQFWNELITPAGTKSFVFWDSAQVSGFGTGDGVWVKPAKPLVPSNTQPIVDPMKTEFHGEPIPADEVRRV